MGSSDDVIRRLFDLFTQRDAGGVVALFASEGVLQDPHYPPPIGPVPSRGAFEVATTHKLFDGPELPVSQVFVVELDGDGLIQQAQRYVPYPPPPPPAGG